MTVQLLSPPPRAALTSSGFMLAPWAWSETFASSCWHASVPTAQVRTATLPVVNTRSEASIPDWSRVCKTLCRCRDPERVHGGGHVRHQSSQENRHRERFPRSREQSHQILRQVQRDPAIHDLQLNPPSRSLSLFFFTWETVKLCAPSFL